jgi:hypothetical protein
MIMKKNIVLMFVLLLLSGTAAAWGIGSPDVNKQAQAQGQLQGQQQKQSQKQNQGQGQNQSATAIGVGVGEVDTNVRQGQAQGMINKGNKTTITETHDYKDTYKKYTPSANAPSMGVSATCMVGVSGGVGAPGFSASFGTYIKDEDCVEAESIRMGMESGDDLLQNMASMVLEKRLQRHLDSSDDVALNGRVMKEQPQVASTMCDTHGSIAFIGHCK